MGATKEKKVLQLKSLCRTAYILGLVEHMSEGEQKEFHEWDGNRPDGVGTSEWPGFDKYFPLFRNNDEEDRSGQPQANLFVLVKQIMDDDNLVDHEIVCGVTADPEIARTWDAAGGLALPMELGKLNPKGYKHQSFE